VGGGGAIITKIGNNNETEIGRRETQPRKKLPFSREEYEDLVNHIPNTWKETIKVHEKPKGNIQRKPYQNSYKH
jgi:hypothetical protein